jgi:multidrug resistance efflux pump
LPPVEDISGATAEGQLEPIRFVEIHPNSSGLVSEVLVKQGDQVQAGQLMARVESGNSQTLEAAQASAAQELGLANQAVHDAQDELDAYPLPRIFVGMTAEQAARMWLEKLEQARADFAPYADTSRKVLRKNHRFVDLPRIILFDTNEFSRMAKEYKKHLDIAWVNYRKSVAWLALDSSLQSAKANLVQARKRNDSVQDASFGESTAAARGALANADIRAPFTGTITNLDLKVGAFADAAQAVVTLADLSSWAVKTTNLTEFDVVNLKEGQPATVTLDAIPGLSLTGHILSIGQNYSERQGDIVYPVTIVLMEQAPELRWGLTAQVTFTK